MVCCIRFFQIYKAIPDRRIRVHASTFNNECSPVVQYVLFVIKADALGISFAGHASSGLSSPNLARLPASLFKITKTAATMERQYC